MSPIPGSTDRVGAAMTPAKPASMAPKPKTRHEQPPDIDAERGQHRRLLAPARTSAPARVRSTSSQSSPAVASPPARIASR